jgi:signal transduction histidine kinase
MSRKLLVLLSVIGVAATAGATVLVLFAHDFEPFGPTEKLAQVTTDAIWISTGLIAWQRRPENRIGMLMTAVGFIDLAQKLYWDSALTFTLSELISFMGVPVFVYLFLAFPSGRLSTGFERIFVAFTAIAIPALAVIDQLFWDWRSSDCPDCPPNLMLVAGHSQLGTVLDSFGTVLLIGVLAVGAALFIRRVRSATGPTRRALAPVLIAASCAVVALGIVLALDVAGRETEGSIALWVADVAYAAIPFAFLVGLLRTRLHRSAVADLVVRLSTLATPTQLRDAIAQTLGDPSLELAFWLPADARYVDADGLRVDPHGQPGRAVTVIAHDGRPVAALSHDPALSEESNLLGAVSAAASLALDNSRLQAELRAQLAEVRASRARIVEAGLSERRRLERDLHDGAQQRLLAIRMSLHLARVRLGDGSADVVGLLDEADAEVVGALDDLRSLARGLHPAILTEAGLGEALTSLARRAPIPVELRVCPDPLPSAVEATAYFVTAEALANVAKHASATKVSVLVRHVDGRVSVEVEDDGIGGADPAGSGLSGLRDRVEALDGRLRIDSPCGYGTRLEVAIPCA